MWKLFCFLFILISNQIVFGQTATSDSLKKGLYYFKSHDTIMVKGYFKNSQRHKIWNWYQKDGSLLKQIKYKNGQQLWVLYFEKNKAWLKIDRYGKRHIIRACKCRECG